MRKLTILSIICLLGPAFSAGAVETAQRKPSSSPAQKARVIERADQPAPRLMVPADSYRA
jgi:hypothetical protein